MANLSRANAWMAGVAAKCIQRRRNPVSLDRIRNFLVLQCEAPLGSVVHATPLYEALKRTLPDAHISVAASPMASGVLAHNPWIDRLDIVPDPCSHFVPALKAVRRLAASMPSGPRAILTTVGNQRTRVAFVSLLAGRAARAGYTLAPALYDVALHFDPLRGQIECNLDILRRLGHDVAFCEPRVFFSAEDADTAARLLGDPDDARPRIAVVTQNSGGQRNQWSQDRFAQVITELSRLRGATPIFVGTSADVPAIEALRQSLPDAMSPNRGISAAGKTTIPQLAAVLAQCDLIVSLDTGTLHVARAVGLPGVVLAPAWQDAREWLPVGNPRFAILQGPLVRDPGPDYRMEEIGAEQVMEAALDQMEKFPPSVAERTARRDRSTH